jgi:hypothetical protein
VRNRGQDLRFIDAEGGGPLPYEIEAWDESGTSYVWVQVPMIDAASSADYIWMYYGNGSVSPGQNPGEVWSDGFRAVWHLTESATAGASGTLHHDSTGNGNAGVQDGNGSAAGVIAQAQEFDGLDDRIEVPEAGLGGITQAITIEAWAWLDTVNSIYPHVVGAGPDADANRRWQLWWEPGADGWGTRLSTNGNLGYINSGVGDAAQWEYLVTRYDGNLLSILLNGVQIGSLAKSGDLDPPGSPLWIGDFLNMTDREFHGVIDEVRISGVARSDAWIAAQHLSMSQSFVIFGPLEGR